MASSNERVPRLDFSKLPLLPGFGSTRVAGLDEQHHKKSISFTERQEQSGPQPNVVFHTFSEYGARPSPKSNQCQTERQPTRPLSKAKWLRYDREALRLFMYFQEGVSESPLENFRVRKVVLLYYRSDESITVSEPKVENSGLLHGVYLKRTPLSSLAPVAPGKSCLELCDLVVGATIPLYGRVFRIVDADGKTRRFFRDELRVTQPAALPYPEDPVSQRAREAAERSPTGSSVTRANKPRDNLGNFLKFGNKALIFDAFWDDSASPHGEKRKFKVQFFLSDGTVELKEVYGPNCGREPFPKFLSRSVVSKPDGSGPLRAQDFRCGSPVVINGRVFDLVACDAFTKAFYLDTYGLEQENVHIVQEKKQIPRMPQPPYNGFGSEEDSLGSFFNLVPRPPRKNFERQRLFGGQSFSISVQLVSDLPEDQDRSFTLSFLLADETMSMFEPKRRNSGVTGGKFLERGKYENQSTGKHFCTEDFGPPLRAAMDKRRGNASCEAADASDCIVILKRVFRITGASRPTCDFFDIKPIERKALLKDPLDSVLEALTMRDLPPGGLARLRESFRALDRTLSRTLPRAVFRAQVLERLGQQLSHEEMTLLLSRFTNSAHQVSYADFFDAMCPFFRGASPPDQFQGWEPSASLRPLFRNFDASKTGKLKKNEFMRLLVRYCAGVSVDQAQATADRFIRKGELVDFNAFCDAFYDRVVPTQATDELNGEEPENGIVFDANEQQDQSAPPAAEPFEGIIMPEGLDKEAILQALEMDGELMCSDEGLEEQEQEQQALSPSGELDAEAILHALSIDQVAADEESS